MNTIDLHRPLVWALVGRAGRAGSVLRDAVAQGWHRWFAATPRADHDELAELDAHTLRDIGASDRLMARAQARREARRQERDALYLGAASSGWRHW